MCFYRMGKFTGCRERLTHDLVRRVQADEPEAILELLDIFDEKIRQYAMVELYDRNGNPVRALSNEYASKLEDRLVQAFKELGLPGIGKGRRSDNKQKGHGKKGKTCRRSGRGNVCGLAHRRS